MGKVLSYQPDNKNNDIHVNKREDKFEDKNFDDMEEIKEDIYMGVGIKKMKAYKSDLKVNELYKLRDEFWSIKTNPKTKNWRTWDTIKRAVAFDELRASILLEEYSLKTVNGCINHLVDSNGNYYKIPNFCINEPYFGIKNLDEKEVEEKRFKIKIYGWKNFELEVSNKHQGKDLKNEIKQKEQIEENKKVRLFYKGNEIKEKDFIYNHDLNENSPVMLLVQ